ncbi:probable serine/threonine-protein kinase clkA [Anthonomus grandis grandis]|uniref:probable serine/threonine-protein kinase clkA n=1 Tax=Anthonomus grandis grandis TaxID=2921223 RepID=UPI002166A689|nr:probable serine/threonine-protein kinase clkA [Anthonomus grandis grandis]
MLKQCGVSKNDTSYYNGNGNSYKNNNSGQRKRYGNNNNRRNKNYNYNNFNDNGEGVDNEGNNSDNSNDEWNFYGSSFQEESNNNNQNTYQNNRQFNSGFNKNNRNQNDQSGQNRPNFNNYDQTDSSSYDSGQNYGKWPTRGYQGSSSTNSYDLRNQNRNFGGGFSNRPEDDCNDRQGGYRSNNMFDYRNGMNFGVDRPGNQNMRPQFNQNQKERNRRFSYFDRNESDENENNQCISQCVFGYLHLLDEDRSPSESMIIKWLQEHINGSDMDRIKVLRDARRCFARITTTDIEDGCEFSQELSKCLELDLE